MKKYLFRLFIVSAVLTMAFAAANATTIPVLKIDGVNLSFSASETSGVLTINFDSLNLVSKINGQIITPINATFDPISLTVGPTSVNGSEVNFYPAANSESYGIADFSGVVFTYHIMQGVAKVTQYGSSLTLFGTVGIDPLSPSATYTSGSKTYDFGYFTAANSGDITFTLNASENIPSILERMNGDFAGSASFSQVTTPEPTSAVLLGLGLIGLAALSRKKK